MKSIINFLQKIYNYRLDLLKNSNLYRIFERAIRVGLYTAAITALTNLVTPYSFEVWKYSLIAGGFSGFDKFKNVLLDGLRKGDNVINIVLKRQ